MRKKPKPVVLKRSEIRKSVRKPAVRPTARIPDKTKRPARGPVLEDEQA